jgi:hypothetical protein
VRENIFNGIRDMKKRVRSIAYRRRSPVRFLIVTMPNKTKAIPMILNLGEKRCSQLFPSTAE